MLGVQFHNVPKKSFDNSSKVYFEKSSRIENSKINPQQIQRTIQIQLKKASELITMITKQLGKEPKESENSLLSSLRDLQEQIRRKNYVIRQLQNEVNCLKGGNNKSKIKIQSVNANNICEQINCNYVAVVEKKKKFDEINMSINRKKKQIQLVFERYLVRCKNQGKQVIDFIKFKEIQARKKKDIQKIDKTANFSSKKQMSWVCEQRRQQNLSNFQKNQNRLKDTMKNKSVAEAALKTQKKRHKQQMNNFLSKLDFLKDERYTIQQKIKSKQKQLKNAELKFSESRTTNENRARPDPIQDRRLKGIRLKTSN